MIRSQFTIHNYKNSQFSIIEKMTKKRYDVRGMMEWHPVFSAGRSRLQVSFTGGHLCGGASTPASFETEDPVVQAIIEGSKAFKTGRITIGKEDRHADLQPVGQSARDNAKTSVLASEVSQTDCASGAAVSMTASQEVTAPEEVTAPQEITAPHIMEFASVDEASDFLTVKKGIPAEKTMKAEQCVAEGARLGIEVRIRKKAES